MAISKLLCTKSTKNMFLKIVHPGGHKELHDRPIVASEIMATNPNCVVAYSHVFQQPWAVVPSDTILMLGQKFYVVPISTIGKLQRRSSKNYRHSRKKYSAILENGHVDTSDGDNNRNKNKNMKETMGSTGKEGCLSNDKCFMSVYNGIKTKSKGDISNEATLSTTSHSSSSSSENRRNKDFIRDRGSPNRSLAACDQWQPALERICEE